MKSTINVTKAYLPPLAEYVKYLEQIWERGWLTNNGECLQELEKLLEQRFEAKHVVMVSNATLGLQISIKALELTKEVITTPFSYVATTSAIVWEKCQPIFVDINPKSLCIDEKLIEKSITKNTEAILATHVYGLPCNVDTIAKVAKKYKLKVIYDAAHCFDVSVRNLPLVNYGDVSIISFHATKLFHTGEGGAIITNSNKLAKKLRYLRNFGHNGQEAFFGEGTNAKMSELHAAMGLCVLPSIPKRIKRLKEVSELYDSLLNWKHLIKPKAELEYSHNYSYFPIVFKSQKALHRCLKKLNKSNIFPRRYFFPALTKLPYINNQKMPIAENISKKVLCLPLFSQIDDKDVKLIANHVNESVIQG